MNPHDWLTSALWIGITVEVYIAAVRLHRRWKGLHPLFILSAVLILLLYATGVPYETYKLGGGLLEYLLGPATVALGIPIYKHARILRKHLRAILTGLVAGSLSGLISAGLLTWVLHGSREIILSMMPKSVTTPVSIEIVSRLGGIPELGAVLTVLTGLLGSMIGPSLLRGIGLGSDIAIGTAMGTAAHGIGTARVIGESELQGSIAGFSMGLNAVVISVLVIPLYWYFQ